MNTLFQKIGSVIVGTILSITGALGITDNSQVIPVADSELTQIVEQVNDLQNQLNSYKDYQNLGATIPIVVAKFETSLATGITSSDTSMTLVKGTDAAGSGLNGYTCFAVDEGSSSEEFVCGTASSTSVTAMIRGIDPIDGDLEVSALKKAHRRGASVKITNHPSLSIALRILNGNESIPNAIKYSTTTPGYVTSADQLAHKGYVDAQVVAGGVPASETVPGISEIATLAETVSGTATSSYSGTDYFLTPKNDIFNATSSATSTVPVTKSNGKLSQGFLDLTESFTFSGGITSSATSTLSGPTVISGTTTTISSTNFNVTGTSTFSGNVYGATKFLGTGADGVLTGSSTIDIGNERVLVKNYSSINLSSGHIVNFSNSTSSGSIVILKSTGACTIAGTINASSTGATGGAAHTNVAAGNAGTDGKGLITLTNKGTEPTAGAAITLSYNATSSAELLKYPDVFVGAGGAGGEVESNPVTTGSAGGNGAGALIFECNSWNFTGTINAVGSNGTTGAYAGSPSLVSGGGGGGGGYVRVLYNTLTANSGTVNVGGGIGGNCSAVGASCSANAGGGGGGSVSAGANGNTNPVADGAKNGGDGGSGSYKIEKNTIY